MVLIQSQVLSKNINDVKIKIMMNITIKKVET